jgi:hypothetical protein
VLGRIINSNRKSIGEILSPKAKVGTSKTASLSIKRQPGNSDNENDNNNNNNNNNNKQ